MSYPRSARVTYNLHRGKFSVSRRERVIVFQVQQQVALSRQ